MSEDDVRVMLLHGGEELVEVGDRRNQVDILDAGKEGSGTLPDEVVVLREDDAQGHEAIVYARR